MTQKEILEFINNNMSCSLATCDGNKPRVRGMQLYKADGKGLIFHTGAGKDLYKQLLSNPNVELCFYGLNPQNFMQVRVSGIAMRENDDKLREEILSARPFLKPIVAQHGKESLAIFRVKKMMATVWTMAKNLDPKEYISIK